MTLININPIYNYLPYYSLSAKKFIFYTTCHQKQELFNMTLTTANRTFNRYVTSNATENAENVKIIIEN